MSAVEMFKEKINDIITMLGWLIISLMAMICASFRCRIEDDKEDYDYRAQEQSQGVRESQGSTTVCKCGKDHAHHIEIVDLRDGVDAYKLIGSHLDVGVYYVFIEHDGDIFTNNQKLVVYEEFATGRNNGGIYIGSWKKIPECITPDLLNPCASCGEHKSILIFEPPYGSSVRFSCNRLECRASALQYLRDRRKGAAT